MKEGIDTDFPVHCRVIGTDESLKAMFPIEEMLVDAIGKQVEVAHHPESRWSAFPESVVTEGELYSAFVSVASVIHSAAEELCSQHPGENTSTARLGGSARWHSKTSKSEAPVRPNCLLAHSLLHGHASSPVCQTSYHSDEILTTL